MYPSCEVSGNNDDSLMSDLVIESYSQNVELVQEMKAPKILDRFLVGQELGSGTYSKVKEAIDVYTCQRVAIKIMQNRRLKRIPNGQDRAKQECRVLKALKHGNVIKYIDVFYSWEKQKLYLVMEYCAATLQELLESTPTKTLPQHQCQGYYKQLLQGLAYIHGKGVIHKDVKPGNLLLTNNDTLKLSDFGVADVLDPFSEDDTVTVANGTPAFQAPECYRASVDTYSGSKLDMWASGVTLWNMATGTYPFPIEASGWVPFMEQMEKGEYTMPESIEDTPLAELLRCVLNVDVDKRYTCAQAMQHKWTVTPPPTDGDDGARVVVAPRRHDDDPDRGTTLCPFLDAMHGTQRLRKKRLEVALDEDMQVDEQVQAAQDEKSRSITSKLASLFSS